jgi:Mycotoxin biosynthesis protein UstYa
LWGDDETTSIYIQDPSPEVDAAWNHIAADASPIITINREEAIRLGRDPDVIVKAPKDWGMGNDAYPAQIDVFHEVHCLNMLRKEMVRYISVLLSRLWSLI